MSRQASLYDPAPTRIGQALQWILDHVSEPDGECLIWPFYRDKQGYGRVGVQGKALFAHRVMCIEAHGQMPSFAHHHAAHRCGGGHLGCVHPRHVRWTLPEDNYAEKGSHGRIPAGETHYRSKLKLADVAVIRAADLSALGATRDLAKKFGVVHSTIWRIRTGEAYK